MNKYSNKTPVDHNKAISTNHTQKPIHTNTNLPFSNNRPEVTLQRKMQTIASNFSTQQYKPIQCFSKSTLKKGLGTELLEKHIANVSFPSLSSNEEKENVLESVFYNRPKDDRKAMNTVFFATPENIEQDLLNTVAGDEIDYKTNYTTTKEYPAITVLRVFNEDSNKYVKAQIQHGNARPVIKVNNKEGTPSFNHLQNTNPKKLGTEIDLLKK